MCQLWLSHPCHEQLLHDQIVDFTITLSNKINDRNKYVTDIWQNYLGVYSWWKEIWLPFIEFGIKVKGLSKLYQFITACHPPPIKCLKLVDITVMYFIFCQNWLMRNRYVLLVFANCSKQYLWVSTHSATFCSISNILRHIGLEILWFQRNTQSHSDRDNVELCCFVSFSKYFLKHQHILQYFQHPQTHYF